MFICSILSSHSRSNLAYQPLTFPRILAHPILPRAPSEYQSVARAQARMRAFARENDLSVPRFLESVEQTLVSGEIDAEDAPTTGHPSPPILDPSEQRIEFFFLHSTRLGNFTDGFEF